MPNKGDLIRDLWSFTSCRQFVARTVEDMGQTRVEQLWPGHMKKNKA